ncbi:HIT family protein [Marinicauda sp. Alg238-R41]|uniref:HIT family protein n=1 Tax=Marinicauda sp. Alg238-R41 TaxID=2993447 RepID=UPI0022E7BE42|nr:HIT family protein [Marinicauda sp. Alg238-R41]
MSLHGDYDDDNVFAKMISGQIPAVKVHEDEHVLCVMDIFPQSPGHTLVIPKERARNLLELSDEAAQAAITRVKAIASAVAKGLDPDGVTVTQFNGAPAGQSIFHIHFHVIPRYTGQAIGEHGQSGQADTETLKAQAEKIKAAL